MLIKIFTLLSRLSFRKLYILSDVIYILLYRVVGYRKAIVRKNLRTSFPEKTSEELRQIEHGFYHWLCDYFVETLKLLSITPEEMMEHIEFHGMEHVTKAVDDGHGISAILGHYCNWEWLSAAGLFYPEGYKNIVSGLIYHQLRNKTFDKLMLQARSSLGGDCIPKQKILRELVRLRNSGTPYLFGYIFDQGPKWENIHLWLDFLHHNTPVFTGAERIARKTNDTVLYVSMERPERGRYVATFHFVTDDPASLPEYEVTRRCFRLLEQDIHRQPQFYLWTHNRWKRTHEEYVKLGFKD